MAQGSERAAAPPPGEPWTVLRMILWSANYLEGKGIERARLDAEHLLSFALGTERLQLYLQFDRPLEADELDRYRPLLRRRAAREPLQYIQGIASFRELELSVDPRVLIPRPETEGLVSRVLDWAAASGRRGLTAWDVGTGSGAIALSLATEGAFESVTASDVSDEALAVARHNAEVAGVTITWRSGDLFEVEPSVGRVDVIASNPPYVAERERGDLAVEVLEWEPQAALFAGDEGLDVLVRLISGAPERLRSGGLLALEIGAEQAARVREVAEGVPGLGRVRVEQDLAGRDRYLLAEWHPVPPAD